MANRVKKLSGSPAAARAKGYSSAGASWSKRAMKGFDAASGSAARDIDDNNLTLRRRSRILYMSAPLATSAIRTVRTNSVGSGLRPKPRPDRELLGMAEGDAADWCKRVEREFGLWADSRRACDASGMNSFYELQQLAMQAWLMSGDVFAAVRHRDPEPMRPYGLRLQLLEADRISTPSGTGSAAGFMSTGRTPDGNAIYDGVEVDRMGLAVAYHVSNAHPWEIPDAGAMPEHVRIPIWGEETGLPNILHVMEAERPGQYRGVPYLAQVIEPLLQMRRYTESELVAAVVESFFTAFVKTDEPGEVPFNEIVPPGESGGARDDDEYEMGPGQVNFMEPGEDIVFADPKRPSSGFDSFVGAMCRQIGAALEIPGELLLKNFNSSYSASRAALLEAWKAFRMRRAWFVDDFCTPVWELWMSEAVARGRIHAPGFFTDPLAHAAYLQCEWVGPSQGQLDPVKEVTAELKAIGSGLTTHEAAAIRLNGSNWDENMDRLDAERTRMGAPAGTGDTEGEIDE